MRDISLTYGVDKLIDDNELIINHPHLTGIKLCITKESQVMLVLGVPTKMYGENYIVCDNADTIHNEHDVLLNAEDMEDYIKSLCNTTSKKDYHYMRKLKETGLQVGSKIEFGDGNQAVISPLTDDCPDVSRALFYTPIKKSGELSKVKPRILYGGTVFKVLE